MDTKIAHDTIEYIYEVEGAWEKIFTNEKFIIQYSVSIKDCPISIANIPFVCDVLPIAWLYDAEIVLETIDERFYN